jgi:hypothetical protein
MISKAPPIFSKLGREPAQAPANFSKDKAWISLDFISLSEMKPFQWVIVTPGHKKFFLAEPAY